MDENLTRRFFQGLLAAGMVASMASNLLLIRENTKQNRLIDSLRARILPAVGTTLPPIKGLGVDGRSVSVNYLDKGGATHSCPVTR